MLTDAELAPWRLVKTRLRVPACNVFAGHSQDSDQRDADLMLVVESVKGQMRFQVSHVWHMLLRGWMYIDTLGDFKVRE